MDTIQRGVTHCDTIGDIFQNPILFRFVAEWHLIKRDGEALGFRLKEKGTTKFTPKYYEFIRSIFEDRGDMEDFLGYIREQLLANESLYAKIKEEYSCDDLIKMLLSCDEINNQTSRVHKMTIQSVFQTKIYDIVVRAQEEPSYIKESVSDDYDVEELPSLSIYYGIEEAIDSGIMPISQSGEILGRISKGNVGEMVSAIGQSEVFEVDKFGNTIDEGTREIKIVGEEVLNTRVKVLERIVLLERIIEYHFRDTDISNVDKSFYIQQREEFQSATSKNLKDMSGDSLAYIKFGRYLVETRQELETKFKGMGKKPERLEVVHRTQ